MKAVLLFVALSLALTSQAWAVSRGQSAVAGEYVLCIGHLSIVVEVDAEGQPLGPRMLCEHCTDVSFAVPEANEPEVTAIWLKAKQPKPTTPWLNRSLLRPVDARAPPLNS